MKIKKLEVIISENGDAVINENQLGLYVDENEVKKAVRKEIEKQLEKYEISDILALNLEEMVTENVNAEMEERFATDDKLEKHIASVVKEETLLWIGNNIDNELLRDIIKEAMVEKLKEFSFEQVKELVRLI